MLFNRSKKRIYMDYAASAPIRKEVIGEMKPYMTDIYANASSLYGDGVLARTAVENTRKKIADILGTTQDTIIFTSGGTEANNLAILGAIRKYKKGECHIITTGIEHASVLEPIRKLEKEGCSVTYVPVDERGQVDVEQIIDAVRENTILITLMLANNEIGTILPIAEIGTQILKLRKKNKSQFPLFHTDACQASNYLSLSVEKMHVDLLTLNGAKIYGPKGVGILYKRRNLDLEPLMYGGGQENGLRAGTEDVASIVGFGTALFISQKERVLERERIKKMRDRLWLQIQKSIPNSVLNGPELDSGVRLVNNLNVSFIGAEAETIVLYLDAKGIMASSGSACSLDSGEPSHVLKACVLSKERLDSCVRFTLGIHTTDKEIDYVMKHLPNVISTIRNMSK